MSGALKPFSSLSTRIVARVFGLTKHHQEHGRGTALINCEENSSRLVLLFHTLAFPRVSATLKPLDKNFRKYLPPL